MTRIRFGADWILVEPVCTSLFTLPGRIVSVNLVFDGNHYHIVCSTQVANKSEEQLHSIYLITDLKTGLETFSRVMKQQFNYFVFSSKEI